MVRQCVTHRPHCYDTSQPSDLAGGISGKQGPGHTLFFLSLAHLLPFFGSGICLSGKAGMSSLNCVYLLALWCESAPRQLHINLVSSLYLFSSASLPWPNLWLSFPCSLLSQWQGTLCRGCSGLRQERALSLSDELQSDAKSCNLCGRAKIRPGLSVHRRPTTCYMLH